MKPRNKLVAAASFLVAIGAGIAVLAVMTARPTIAFADVKAQLQQAKTIQMTVTSEFPKNSPFTTQPAMGEAMQKMKRIRMTIREGGLSRQEYPDAGVVSITDMNKKKTLTLDANRKTAIVMDFTVSTALAGALKGQIDWLEEVQKCLQGSEQTLDERVINGQKVKGFLCTMATQEMEVWADNAGHPVLITMRVNFAGLVMNVTMSDIVINPDVPDSFFSVDPPDGYTVQDVKGTIALPTEKDLVEGLRWIALFNDDRFPNEVSNAAIVSVYQRQQTMSPAAQDEWRKKIHEKLNLPTTGPTSKLTQQQVLDKTQAVMRMAMFPTLHAGDDFHYAGAGVKVGDATTPIAWWRQSNGSTYRVLYGDLTFKDQPASELPTTAPCSRPLGHE